MELINNFDLYELSHAIGWSLIHSVWQTAVIGGIIWLIFRFISKDNARIRYALSGLGLLLICVASAITFCRYIPSNTSTSLVDFTALLGTSDIIPQEESFLTKLWTQIQIQLENSFPYLVKIWMIGMLFLSINLILKYIYTLKLKKHLTYPLRPNYKSIADRLVTKYNLKQNILFKESGLLEIPSVIGYFKPVVLLPVSMLSGIPENQLEIIIAHELAHIRRHDYLLQFIQGIIELIFFYHPVVWWLSSVVNAEREHICDDLAVKVCGESLTLIKALNNMEAIRKKQYELVLGFSGKKGKVLNRIKRILRPKASTNPRRERFVLSGVFTLLFAGLFLISNFAISGNTDYQKAFFSKINILDKTADQSDKSIQNEELPLDLINAKSDQKKKKEAKKQTEIAATEIELEEVTEVEKIELSEMPPMPVMPTMPTLPPAVEMPFNSFDAPEFSFPKDSVKSDKWVKLKADEIIKEQRKNIQQQLEKIESPEFQEKMNQQIKESKTRIQEDIKRVNSDEYRKELEERIKNNPTSSFNQDSTTPSRWGKKGHIRPTLGNIGNPGVTQFSSLSSGVTNKHPLILLDGKKITQEQMDKISPNEFASISVLKDDSAIKLYGKEAKNGVILITSKSENITKKGESDSINTDDIMVLGYSYMKNPGTTFVGNGYTSENGVNAQGAKRKYPLFVVDGKKLANADSRGLDENNIESINVIKGEQATAKYGKEAINGVIEITSKSNNQKNTSAVKLNLGDTINPPLFILDGNKISSEAATKVHPDDIKNINILKGKEAIKKYGESAKNGAIEINSKGLNFKDPIKIDNAIYVVDGKKLSKKESEKIKPDDIESINVLKGKPAIEKYGKKGKNGVVEITSKTNNKQAVKMKLGSIKNPPLFIVDGKITAAKKVEEINSNDIENINVLKGEQAIEKYGEEAKNGVIVITLKTKFSNLNSSLNFLENTDKNEPLYIINGERISEEKMKNIDPNSIDYITVLKDENATSQYGKEAKNGAVVIRLKE